MCVACLPVSVSLYMCVCSACVWVCVLSLPRDLYAVCVHSVSLFVHSQNWSAAIRLAQVLTLPPEMQREREGIATVEGRGLRGVVDEAWQLWAEPGGAIGALPRRCSLRLFNAPALQFEFAFFVFSAFFRYMPRHFIHSVGGVLGEGVWEGVYENTSVNFYMHYILVLWAEVNEICERTWNYNRTLVILVYLIISGIITIYLMDVYCS